MKRWLAVFLCLALLLVPMSSLADRMELPDYGITLDFSNDWIVLTDPHESIGEVTGLIDNETFINFADGMKDLIGQPDGPVALVMGSTPSGTVCFAYMFVQESSNGTKDYSNMSRDEIVSVSDTVVDGLRNTKEFVDGDCRNLQARDPYVSKNGISYVMLQYRSKEPVANDGYIYTECLTQFNGKSLAISLHGFATDDYDDVYYFSKSLLDHVLLQK